MSDENKTPQEAAKTVTPDTPTPDPSTAVASAEAPVESKPAGRGRGGNNQRSVSNENPLSDKPLERKWRGRGGKGWGRWRGDKQQKEFQEILLEVRRVTRVTTGGRQLAFRAIIVIGNGKGKIGLWVAKGNDVQIAVRKATHEAYKNIVTAPITDELTVPYGITHKYKSAIIKIMPATVGTGMKAGSSVRSVLELAGYNNILSKIIGTNNKLNNAIAAIQALAKYKVGKTPPKQWDDKKKGKNTDTPTNEVIEKSGKKEVKEMTKEEKEEVAAA